ncbi:MAG: hypothetical protein H6Q25_1654 [Bacteroidetes bacterium]|nr:hypothetical protein [Bacteroidota bacterium]
MQKFFLALAVLMLTLVSYAQQEEYQLGISKQFFPNDTTRTFTVIQGNLDQVKMILSKTYGEPEGSGGVVCWKNIKIPGIAKKVKVILHDGIMTDGEDMFTITYSNDEVKYKESLTKLEQNQSRYMDIQVLNMKGEEIINTYQLETLINDYLLQILNKK